ncbi:hypothetical protein G9A89_003895 [Geosiphon pyriformis]|nr:hypothetical protein G9A89_003895 [Geosiphon pyriformis]
MTDDSRGEMAQHIIDNWKSRFYETRGGNRDMTKLGHAKSTGHERKVRHLLSTKGNPNRALLIFESYTNFIFLLGLD